MASVNALSLRRRLFAVLCGGFCGTITRYLLSMLIQGWLGKSWPYDILFINITGAFILALVTTLADATVLIGPTRRLFINVGFLGAYTTFSSLALGDVLLFGKEQWLPAVVYLVASIVGGVLAVLLGNWLGQECVRWGKRAKLHIKRLSASPLVARMDEQHVDMQNDRLLPDTMSERETKQRGS